MALSTKVTQQETATSNTNTAITELLDYIVAYPEDDIIFRASGIVLAAHADAGSLNETKARSRAGAHIILTGDVTTPPLNVAILTIFKDHQTRNGISSRS